MKNQQPAFESPCPRVAKSCGLAIAAGLLLCQGAQAASYLQDGFNYPPGVLGADLPWTNSTSLITVVSGGLTSPALADFSPPGNAVNVAPGSAVATARPFDTAATSGSVYFSALIKFTTASANYYIAGLLPGTVGAPAGNASDPCDLIVMIGATGGYNLGIRAKGQSAVYAPSVLTLGTVYFVVVKYEFASGRASLYLTASPGGSEPSSADVVSTPGTGLTVPNLDHLFVRVGGATAGNFILDSLRVASTWAEVTPLGAVSPATKLAFTVTPTVGTAGAPMPNLVVQLQNASGFNIPSNNVPVTVTLNTGAFASGTTTVNSDAYGSTAFNDLVVGQPGTYTLTATASGIGAGLSAATSSSIVIVSTNSTAITQQGYALLAFLDSLNVAEYWADGVSVNWLTGAAGGSGPNMTQGTASHCSAFAAAVTDLLGIYLLRPPQASDMGLADNQAVWLQTNQTAGWYAIASMVAAQSAANAGALVVASYNDPNTSGHIAILRPSTRSNADILAYGPEECQSGIYNYNDTNVMTGFNQHSGAFPNGIRYYGHAITNPIVPVNPILCPGSPSNGVFRAQATNIVGRKYTFQCTSNFVSWTSALTYTNSNGGSNFFCVTPLSDALRAGAPCRFYRLLAQ